MATFNIKRFSDDLYKMLQKNAAANCRSVAQEVICLLQMLIEEPSRHSILELRGLGKEIWKDTNTSSYINSERELWK